MDILIRPACPEDAAALNAMRRMPGTFENILGLPSEPVSSSTDFLAAMDGRTQHQLVAVLHTAEGQDLVAGAAGLSVSPQPRTRHTAAFGIMVRTDCQGMGVGRALTDAVLDIADHWLMLVRVELQVFTDNERAIRLYESVGFEKEGVRRMAAIRAGRYADEYLMSRIRPLGGVS